MIGSLSHTRTGSMIGSLSLSLSLFLSHATSRTGSMIGSLSLTRHIKDRIEAPMQRQAQQNGHTPPREGLE